MRGFGAALFGLAAICVAATAAEPVTKLVVDTAKLTLTVWQDGRAKVEITGVSLGRFGATASKRRGDWMTPLGRYRVAWVRRGRPFAVFIGIDYPSVADADRGLAAGLIGPGEHKAIVAAHALGSIPPQSTALGGQIGIHGLGQADPDVHAAFNWTRGCVALTDEQIRELLPWISLGTPVEIR